MMKINEFSSYKTLIVLLLRNMHILKNDIFVRYMHPIYQSLPGTRILSPHYLLPTANIMFLKNSYQICLVDTYRKCNGCTICTSSLSLSPLHITTTLSTEGTNWDLWTPLSLIIFVEKNNQKTPNILRYLCQVWFEFPRCVPLDLVKWGNLLYIFCYVVSAHRDDSSTLAPLKRQEKSVFT